MAWDTTSALSSDAVAAVRLERTTLGLWQEFLAGYFSGGIHTLSGTLVAFPAVELSFQADRLPSQVLDGQAISVVWDKRGKILRRLVNGARVGYINTTFTFYIRAGGQNIGDGGPKVTVKRVADLLFALLSDKDATLPLARKGMRRIRPQQHTPITSNQWIERVMPVYAILETDLGLAPGSGSSEPPEEPMVGDPAPEGVVTANPGRIYTRISGGLKEVWVKETGSGNTGWQLWVKAE